MDVHANAVVLQLFLETSLQTRQAVIATCNNHEPFPHSRGMRAIFGRRSLLFICGCCRCQELRIQSRGTYALRVYDRTSNEQTHLQASQPFLKSSVPARLVAMSTHQLVSVLSKTWPHAFAQARAWAPGPRTSRTHRKYLKIV